jgi:hypothetical protein
MASQPADVAEVTEDGQLVPVQQQVVPLEEAALAPISGHMQAWYDSLIKLQDRWTPMQSMQALVPVVRELHAATPETIAAWIEDGLLEALVAYSGALGNQHSHLLPRGRQSMPTITSSDYARRV